MPKKRKNHVCKYFLKKYAKNYCNLEKNVLYYICMSMSGVGFVKSTLIF